MNLLKNIHKISTGNVIKATKPIGLDLKNYVSDKSCKFNSQFYLIFHSDFEDIELQVLSTKETRCDSVSPSVPGTFFHSVSNRSQQGRTISSVNEAVCGLSAAGATASSDQHCDVKVDVHRKSSSASSEPAIMALDAQPDETTRQSITKSKVAIT